VPVERDAEGVGGTQIKTETCSCRLTGPELTSKLTRFILDQPLDHLGPSTKQAAHNSRDRSRRRLVTARAAVRSSNSSSSVIICRKMSPSDGKMTPSMIWMTPFLTTMSPVVMGAPPAV